MLPTLENEISEAFAALSKYDFGQSTESLYLVENCVRASYGQPKALDALTHELTRMIDSNASLAARQFACKTLWRLGPERTLLALSKLLASSDVHLVEAACYAIGNSPSSEADRLLRDALERSQRGARVTVINLIGSRGDSLSVSALQNLASNSDNATAEAAMRALGKIGTPDAIAALERLQKQGNSLRQFMASAALLEGAQTLAAHGESPKAVEAVAQVSSDMKQIRRGADRLREDFDHHDHGFVPLFNGRDLSEWDIDTPGLWQVRNGVIMGRSPGLKYNDFLRTKKVYKDFVLTAKFRMIDGAGNSGIQFRSKPASIPHELEGYQADAGERFWGALYDESRRKKTLAGPDEAFLNRLDPCAWHTYVISAKANHIRLHLDGVETVNYGEPDPNIESSGIIALQIHAWPKPVEVWFRDLKIQVL